MPYCYHYHPLIHIIAMSVWEGCFGEKRANGRVVGAVSLGWQVWKYLQPPSIHVYVCMCYYLIITTNSPILKKKKFTLDPSSLFMLHYATICVSLFHFNMASAL